MRKTEYDPQAIRSISAFDSHKKQLIALLQNDIIGHDMEESSDDTMKNLSKIRCLLSGMMAYAVEKNIIQTNPVREISLNQLTFKPVQDARDNVFTEDEAQKLLAHLKTIGDDPYALAIRLDFNLFIRVGELTGLKWEDVDIDKRTVYICHQVTYEPELKDNLSFGNKVMTTEGYLKGCTSQGYRHEYLTDEAIEILKLAHKLNPDGEYVL